MSHHKVSQKEVTLPMEPPMRDVNKTRHGHAGTYNRHIEKCRKVYRSPPPKRKKRKNPGSEIDIRVERMFQKMVIQSRERRDKTKQNGGDNEEKKAMPPPNINENEIKKQMVREDQYLVQREDLERMRCNKALIENMRTSICSLYTLTEGLSKDINDVKTQHKAATNLWKDLTSKFKEMNGKLHYDESTRAGSNTKIKQASQARKCVGSSRQEKRNSNLHLPKIQADTPAASTSETNEQVNKDMVSRIKLIAYKRSLERSRERDVSPGPRTESVQNAYEMLQKIKKKKRVYVAKRLRELDEYWSRGKADSVSQSDCAAQNDKTDKI